MNINNRVCLNCSKQARSRCSRCLIAYYCDSQCQRNHWKSHKLQCNSNKAQDSSDAQDKSNKAQDSSDAQDSSEPVLSYTVLNDQRKLDYFVIVTIDDDKPKSIATFKTMTTEFMSTIAEKGYSLDSECLCLFVKMNSEKDKAQKFGIHIPIVLNMSTFTRLLVESSSSSFNEFVATAAKYFYGPLLHRIPSKVRDKTLEKLATPPEVAGQLISQMQVHNLRVTSRTHHALKKYWNKESSSDYIHGLWGSWNYEQRRKFIRSVRFQTPESDTQPYYINRSGYKEDVSGMLLFCPELNLKYLTQHFPSFLDQSVSTEFDDHIKYALAYFKEKRHLLNFPKNTDIDKEYISIEKTSYGKGFKMSEMPENEIKQMKKFVKQGFVATSDQYWFIDQRLRDIFDFLAAAIDDIRRDYKQQKYIKLTKIQFNSYCGCCRKSIDIKDELKDEDEVESNEVKCQECKIIAYCSTKCADADAAKHKPICNIFKSGICF